MKHGSGKQMAALALAAVLMLSGSASALFGKKEAPAEGVEGAPVARDLEITTYRGIPYTAQLLASDSEGDDLTFSVAQGPKKGTVTIDGANFTYTPKERTTGGDRFTYTATDSNGNVSLPATVTVTIEKARSGVTYSDLEGNDAAVAAQCLAERGIFVGSMIGGQYRFEPEAEVTRSEFLAMVLETAGREVTAVTMTGFSDDEAIPTWAKAYASAGAADGVVRGKVTEEGPAFRGGESITFSEAATMMDRVLDTEDVDLDVWYADREAVPSWAAQAVCNMEAVSVLPAASFGTLDLERAVTRADAAKMIAGVLALLEGRPEETGLFGWNQ